jgi:hypothetical protein
MRYESREHELESALFSLYEKWWHALEPDLRSDKFWQAIDPRCKNYRGGVWAVRHLLYSNDTTGGIKPNEPQTGVEELVLSGDWDDFFDRYDKAAARKRMDRLSK